MILFSEYCNNSSINNNGGNDHEQSNGISDWKQAGKGNAPERCLYSGMGYFRKGAVSFPVRGVMAGNRQEALRRLAQYEPSQVRAFLMPEPENKFDNAIAVMVGVQNGRGLYRLGYIPASDTAKAAAVRGRASIRVLPGDINGARLTLAV